VPRVDVHGNFSGGEALAALTGHVLALDAVTGVYTLNPAVRI
jgi:hypothetical protein